MFITHTVHVDFASGGKCNHLTNITALLKHMETKQLNFIIRMVNEGHMSSAEYDCAFSLNRILSAAVFHQISVFWQWHHFEIEMNVFFSILVILLLLSER